MGQQELILKRATRTTPSGELKHDDYDVLCDDKVVGRIMKAAAAPVGTPWLWTFAYGAHRDYSSTYGYAVDREDTKRRSGLPTPGWCIPINRGDQVSPETAAIAVG